MEHSNPYSREMVMEHLVSFVHAPIRLLKRSVRYLRGNGDNSAKSNNSKEDCISKLPDEIIFSIISFLTVRDAVKTSVLSKRWRHLYASMSSLDFDWCTLFGAPGDSDSRRGSSHLCPQYRHTFVGRVNQFLQLYSGPKIFSFRFSFCFKREFAGDVDRWISFAVSLGVEKLDLNFACTSFFTSGTMFSDNYSEMYILSCQRLSDASQLNHLCLSLCILQLDFGFHFNNLITLDLNYVPLSHGELQSILSRCLKLEWLGVRGCSLPGKLCICGPFLHLKFLVVHRCPGLKEIDLSAVNLTTFEFSDQTVTKFSFSNVPKLEKVFFCLRYSHAIRYISSELAKDLPQLRTLSISTFAHWVLHLPQHPTTFSNVKQLELFMNHDFEYDLLRITPILSACPLLQKFLLVMPHPTNSEQRMEEPPECVHTQLKEVEIGGLYGTWNQIEFATFLLKNAVSLERMVIDSHYRLYLGGGKWKHGCSVSWSEGKRNFIHKQLQGKAFSETAKVIIR